MKPALIWLATLAPFWAVSVRAQSTPPPSRVPAVSMGGPVTLANSPVTPKPWLGVVSSVNAGQRAVVHEVIPDAPADIAGIQPGDVIVEFGQRSIKDFSELVSAVGSFQVGDKVPVQVRRGGRALTFTARLTPTLSQVELMRRRLLDQELPELEVEVLRGAAKPSSSAMQGKVLVLTLWYSHCRSCVDSFSDLANLQVDLLGDVEVLAISHESRPVLERFVSANETIISIAHDATGAAQRALQHDTGDPLYVVVGRDGIIRHVDVGTQANISDVSLAARRAVLESNLL